MKYRIVMKDYRRLLLKARESLGRPAALDEALVDTGIDAFLWLLDGGVIEIDGRPFRLEEYVEAP
jgi:hypothetical protein